MSIRRLIPNLFTAGNLICGVLAIFNGLTGELKFAAILILVALLFDFLDGFLARLLKAEGELGKQLDSLADIVTFGVAPAMMVFMYFQIGFYYQEVFVPDFLEKYNSLSFAMSIDLMGEDANSLPFVNFSYLAFIIPVFAMFRLAKFNISEDNKEFTGLATPAVGLFFASFALAINHDLTIVSATEYDLVRFVLNPMFLTVSTIVLSLLMIAPIKMFSLKFKHGKWKDNEIRYTFLTISLVLLATLFWWALPIIIVLYVILSIINNLLSRKAAEQFDK